jgi:hypothetical protein
VQSHGCSPLHLKTEELMAKKAFSAVERFAVYIAHCEKCYLCTKSIDLKTMQVDHVIPDSLEGTAKLAYVVLQLGLPPTFNLQSYENWLPSCGPCNNLKKDQVFEPVPIVLALLKKTAEKAPKARALASKVLTEQRVQKTLNMLERAVNENGHFGKEIMAQLAELLRFQTANRAPEMVGKPILIGPGLQLLSDQNGLRIVRGPYGVGGGPSTDHVPSAMIARAVGPLTSTALDASCVALWTMTEEVQSEAIATRKIEQKSSSHEARRGPQGVTLCSMAPIPQTMSSSCWGLLVWLYPHKISTRQFFPNAPYAGPYFKNCEVL